MPDRETRLEIFKWIGTVCTVVGTVITVGTAAPKLTADSHTLALIVLGLAVIAIGAFALFLRMELQAPDFTAVEFNSVLHFLDSAGDRAILTRKLKARANRNLNAGKFLIGSIRSDGPITTVWLNGNPVYTKPPGEEGMQVDSPSDPPGDSLTIGVERTASVYQEYGAFTPQICVSL